MAWELDPRLHPGTTLGALCKYRLVALPSPTPAVNKEWPRPSRTVLSFLEGLPGLCAHAGPGLLHLNSPRERNEQFNSPFLHDCTIRKLLSGFQVGGTLTRFWSPLRRPRQAFGRWDVMGAVRTGTEVPGGCQRSGMGWDWDGHLPDLARRCPGPMCGLRGGREGWRVSSTQRHRPGYRMEASEARARGKRRGPGKTTSVLRTPALCACPAAPAHPLPWHSPVPAHGEGLCMVG